MFEVFVWGVDSMAKLIENNPDMSRRFALRVKGLEDSDVYDPRIKNMKFVKPRYNSAQAPLARSVLFFSRHCLVWQSSFQSSGVAATQPALRRHFCETSQNNASYKLE